MAKKSKVLLVMPRAGRALLVDLLGKLGLPILFASNCEEAARYLRPEHNVDVLLTGVELPDGDWETVLQCVDRMRPHAQVVVCTNFPTPALCGKVFRRGASDILMGPYTLQELRDAVSAARNRSQTWLGAYGPPAA